MLKLHNKKFIKIISLIIIQSFLFAGMLYPESNLRVPMGFEKKGKAGTPGRFKMALMAMTGVSLIGIGASNMTNAQTLTHEQLSPPGITIVDTKTQQLEENLPTQEEQNQILENFRDVSSHRYYRIDWDKLVNKYSSKKVFYALKIAIAKKIINKDVFFCICRDLGYLRIENKEVDSFLATYANEGYIGAYHALYRRLHEDFIKVPSLVITEKAVSGLLKEMPDEISYSILKVIFSNPNNSNFIDPKTLYKFLLKISVKSLNIETVFKLTTGRELDSDQKEQLKKLAFLLGSYHPTPSPSLVIDALKDKKMGSFDGTRRIKQWKIPTPNILEMYIYPERNTLPKSEYRPMSITDQPPAYYSIKNWSEETSITNTVAWPSDFLKKLLKMEKGEILYFNGEKYYLARSPQFLTDIDLRNFLQSFGRDDHGIYMSIYDIWDVKANGGFFKDYAVYSFESKLMDQIGTPIHFYDRYYFPEEDIKKELERRGEKISALNIGINELVVRINTLKERAVSQEALRSCL